MPKSLDLGRLSKFEPLKEAERKESSDVKPDASEIHPERWPSRAPVEDGQISIKGPLKTIQRFKAMCKADRRTYADMLRILMDDFENK